MLDILDFLFFLSLPACDDAPLSSFRLSTSPHRVITTTTIVPFLVYVSSLCIPNVVLPCYRIFLLRPSVF
ncbi:hypothetical protein HYDPIDRAFT_108688 [Hydnomerulius pinastri MD-312]|nr:hypothetical protein HYDPIDRAFT_108688 [Hydnomerulius pinastri MD-312]